jgi:hypothetical protein
MEITGVSSIKGKLGWDRVKEIHGWRKHPDDKQTESPSSYSTLMYNENDIPCNGKNCLQIVILISSSLKRKEKKTSFSKK